MVDVDKLLKPEPPPPPDALAEAGETLWRGVTSEYELRPDERAMLEMACRTADELAMLREAIDGEPLTLTGQRGSTIAHPLLDEIRRHQSLIHRLLAALELDEVDADPHAASNAGRALVRNRWRRN